MSVVGGEKKPINGILTKIWFEDSIIDNVGVSDDDWYHNWYFRWRGDIEQIWHTCDCLQLKTSFKNSLSIYYGKSKPRSGILTKNWFKDSIVDNIGVSDDDWDHHRYSRLRVNVEQGWQTSDFLQFKHFLNYALTVSYGKVSPEMKSLHKTGSKTVFFTILEWLMMIDTTTALPDER